MTTNIPAGWKIEREPTGELIINGPNVGVVVRENPSGARLIPEEALFMLATALLDAPVDAVPGEPGASPLTNEIVERAAIAMDAMNRPPDFLAGVRFAETFYKNRADSATPTAPQAVGEPVHCANCGIDGATLEGDYPDEERFCSATCREQHDELGCPSEGSHSGFRHPEEAARLITCENVLRSLASYLGAGGYNALTVEPTVFEEKIRWGIDQLRATTPIGSDTGYESFKAWARDTKPHYHHSIKEWTWLAWQEGARRAEEAATRIRSLASEG